MACAGCAAWALPLAFAGFVDASGRRTRPGGASGASRVGEMEEVWTVARVGAASQSARRSLHVQRGSARRAPRKSLAEPERRPDVQTYPIL